jgi:PKD repeat protein
MKRTLVIIPVIFTAIAASAQAGDFYFFDDFESGLTEWIIGGRQAAGQNIADTVFRHGSMMGHLYKTSFTEVTFERTFEYDPLLRFIFDMEVTAWSQPAPSAYYALADARFIFVDGTGEMLGDVGYATATTSYIFERFLTDPTRHWNQVPAGVLRHYELPVDELLSQITIDETQIAQVTLRFRCYSSTYPYPSVSAELWVDNLTTTDIPETSNQPPVAVCQDVTVEADDSQTADADVDAGSYDPDGDPITIDQSPPGPYPIGTTEVTLTVIDDAGASGSCTASVTVLDTATNQPPEVDAGESRTCQGGVVVNFMATFVDDASDTHTAWWDYGDGTPGQPGDVFFEGGSGEVYGTHIFDQPGEYTVEVCVYDDQGASACDTVLVTVLSNQPPVAQCQDVTVEAGTDCQADASVDDGSYDPDGDPITTAQDPPGPYPLGDTAVTLTVIDDSGASDTCAALVSVVDTTPPDIAAATVGPDLVGIGETVAYSAQADDECGVTVEWDFGDGSPTSAVDPTTHAYDHAGVYTVLLTATDTSGNQATRMFTVAAYESNGGFVTGGGWVYSDPGNYVPDPALEGKASFGFVSKYKKGASEPTGNTEFQFKAGGLNFHSGSYDSLVVTGSDYAKFKGTGTINGAGDYKFRIWAGDSDPDTFRIKIWTEDDAGVETVVYDNGMDQAIGGGSIVIHAK